MAANLAKRTSLINLEPLVDKKIRVKFTGGREIVGILKGADPVCNLVLDETQEILRESKASDKPRKLGIIFARGTTV